MEDVTYSVTALNLLFDAQTLLDDKGVGELTIMPRHFGLNVMVKGRGAELIHLATIYNDGELCAFLRGFISGLLGGGAA